MDLDLAQMQAFVAVAEQRHFGRAADQLFVTPQALSKRIIRLETMLNERLFIRSGRNVECTAFGCRLLPYAQEMLAAADALVLTARGSSRSLQVDIWDLIPEPMQALQRVSSTVPNLEIEVTMRRNLGDAIAALQRREIDAAFGRVQDLAFPWPDGLSHRLVLLQPIGIAMAADHPLAGVATVAPAELRGCGLWWPIGERPTEVLGYARRFSEHFQVPVDTSRWGVGPVNAAELLRKEPGRVVAWATSWLAPSIDEIRSPRLDPTPLFPWSLIWRRHDRDPALARLIDAVNHVSVQEDWLSYDPAHAWLPDVDASAIRSARSTGPPTSP
jgi:DNA-binding transcriptional LysR family regulator